MAWVMLIRTRKHSAMDLRRWAEHERCDVEWAKTSKYKRAVDRAEEAVREFVSEPCYVGVSWGKDSVVVADIVARVAPTVPIVWVRVEPIANPECALVRDEFLRLHPCARLVEITVMARHDAGGWHASGTLERGLLEAAQRHGDRYISGVRGEESGARKLRMMTHGVATDRACAPIGWWSAGDVYAYLHERGLPVHPAYAYSLGGLLDRTRLRVASMGGQRGSGWGRTEWEQRYYGTELLALSST